MVMELAAPVSFTGRIILAYCQELTGSSDERFARIIREAVCAAAETPA
jgi:hypothetical protein